MALSRWPLPCFATVSNADAFDFGDGWAMRVLRLRSVVDELNVCENQPERREGMSPIDRLLDDSGAGRGIAIGSTTTAASSSRSRRGRNLLARRALGDVAGVSVDDEPLAIGVPSVSDRDRSRPLRWRNLGSFDAAFDGGGGGPGEEGALEAMAGWSMPGGMTNQPSLGSRPLSVSASLNINSISPTRQQIAP